MSFAEPEKLTLIFDAENREEWQRTSYILERLAIRDDMTVADIGAGTGYFSNIFAAQAQKVYAIDCEPNMVSYMQRRFQQSSHSNVDISQSTKTDPCLPNGVDLVFVANTYRFIRERPQFLNNLHAQVSPNTHIVFVDFKGEQAQVSPQMVVAEIEQAGFRVIDLDVSGCPDHYVLSFAKVS